MTEQTSGPEQSAPRRGRRWLVGVLIGVAALFGFAAGTVRSAPWHHWGHHHLDAEEITWIVQHRINRALSKVDATQEQRDKIGAIAKAAINDLLAMRQDRSAMREKALAIFKADNIDHAALEALRAEQIGRADTASKRILQAIEDAAGVLTPEQRRQLASRWEEWRHP